LGTGLVCGLLRLIAKIYFRIECRGCHNLEPFVQEELPFILAINHASILDIPIVGICIGTELAQRFNYPAKRSVFDDRRTAWLVRQVGGFPVDRETLDLAAAREIVKIVRAGRCIGIAPEGTRSRTGEILPFKSGFVKLAVQTRAPIVPVAISGAYEALPSDTLIPRPSRIVVHFGTPIPMDSYWSTRKQLTTKDYEQLAAQVRQAIIDLLEPTLHHQIPMPEMGSDS
jgi:1-acyl-sn-glycerol-3-phosphate acyltransferase